MKFEWEQIFGFTGDKFVRLSARARVIGGWVMHDCIITSKSNITNQSMVFIPDPNHEWKIEE